MKKQQHEFIVDYFKELLPKFQSDYFERRRQTDKVVVWLVALSTASFALLLSNSDNIFITNICYLKAAVSFLLLSVIFGVIFRAYVYPLEQLEAQLILGFESFCHWMTVETSRPREIKDADTIEDIARYLKEDMGFDYDHWLGREYLDRDFWVEHYNSWAEFWQNTETDGLKALGRALAPLSQKKPEETENIFITEQDDSAQQRKYARYTTICNRSYELSLIFFGLAFVSIGLGYIFE